MIDSRGENVVTQSRLQVPSFVSVFSPLALRLIRRGVPLGPNALLTVRGRKSGLMRTNPVAVLARGGRRWVIGTFGEVNWVRNLRAAGEAVRRPRPPTSSPTWSCRTSGTPPSSGGCSACLARATS